MYQYVNHVLMCRLYHLPIPCHHLSEWWKNPLYFGDCLLPPQISGADSWMTFTCKVLLQSINNLWQCGPCVKKICIPRISSVGSRMVWCWNINSTKDILFTPKVNNFLNWHGTFFFFWLVLPIRMCNTRRWSLLPFYVFNANRGVCIAHKVYSRCVNLSCRVNNV